MLPLPHRGQEGREGGSFRPEEPQGQRPWLEGRLLSQGPGRHRPKQPRLCPNPVPGQPPGPAPLPPPILQVAASRLSSQAGGHQRVSPCLSFPAPHSMVPCWHIAQPTASLPEPPNQEQGSLSAPGDMDLGAPQACQLGSNCRSLLLRTPNLPPWGSTLSFPREERKSHHHEGPAELTTELACPPAFLSFCR